MGDVRCEIAKADRWLPEEKKFYHQFSIVKYSYLPTDTFRKYVERHVTHAITTALHLPNQSVC